MMGSRVEFFMLPLLLLPLYGCGGSEAKLIKLPVSGAVSGAVAQGGALPHHLTLIVRNRSDTVIDGFYLAKTDVVKRASGHSQLGSEAEAMTWGDDLLRRALPVGDEQQVLVPAGGFWDARPVDEEGRYQHIAGLRLRPGARYVLELQDGGWRTFR